ncbi:MAG TPA: methyltransferase domain-containing protein [Terrimicrobiaceae bacterium]
MNPTIPKENYIPGHSESTSNFMASRDLESHGFFLLPLLQPGFDVLDAGCGPATISADIADAVFPGKVTALDIATSELDHGRRLAEGREIVNLEFLAASAYEIPVPDSSFDVVFSHALLEHLCEPRRALREFHRLVRPGGFVALCSPDWDAFDISPMPMALGRAINAYRDLLEGNGGNSRAGFHLKEWLIEAGFAALSHDEWMEEYESPKQIAEYLAAQLETAGQFHHATALRDWARDPEARFRQAWKYVTGVRSGGPKRRKRVTE